MPIPVKCQCGQKFAAKEALAGKTVACPKCGGAIQIPRLTPPSPIPAPPTPGALAADDEYELENPVAHFRKHAPAHGAEVGSLASLLEQEGIGGRDANVPVPAGASRCPSCGAILMHGAVLCIQCGYSLQTGKKIDANHAKNRAVDSNPYASPADLADSHARYGGGARGRDMSGRRGPPWENDGDLVPRYVNTLVGVLTSPACTFSRMRRNNGLGPPITFALVSYATAVVVGMLLVSALLLLGVSLMPGARQGSTAVLGFGLFCGMVGGFVCVMSGAVLLLPVVLLIQASFVHVVLMVVGGAKQGYETSFRVTGYVYGTLMIPQLVLAVIPIVGPIASWVLQTVYQSIGLTRAHEISPLRGAMASILANVLMASIMFGLGFAIAHLLEQQLASIRPPRPN